MKITNASNRPIGVYNDRGEHVTLAPGHSINSKKDWNNHLFVKAKWLVLDDQPSTENVKQVIDNPDNFIKYSIRHKSKGWYEVIDENENVVSDKAMREDEAQAKADELNEPD